MARTCASRPSQSAKAAIWACEGLSASCSDLVRARAGTRIAFLSKGAESLAPIGEDRGAWMALGRAQGWADGLGQGSACADAAAAAMKGFAGVQAEAGIAREVFRRALFDFLNWESEEALDALAGLNDWLERSIQSMGDFGFMAAAHALEGLREGFEESSVEQGATESDLRLAIAIKDALRKNWTKPFSLAAAEEYSALSARSAPFHGEFKP